MGIVVWVKQRVNLKTRDFTIPQMRGWFLANEYIRSVIIGERAPVNRK
jgi:hypothetical protein